MTFQIKFKVWDEKYKEMLGPFTLKDLMDGTYPSQLHDNNYPGEDKRCDSCAGEAREDLIWLQFTGVKDIKGREIYIGDIVELRYDFSRDKTRRVVETTDLLSGQYWWQYDEYSNGNFDLDYIKVLGNIYQNRKMRR